MDRGGYEKISITESVGPLKTYGSTSRHISRPENYIKHFVSHTDTLQGIALKYNVTVSFLLPSLNVQYILWWFYCFLCFKIEQIRRVNKLWASDSLFLKEFLLIPTSEPSNTTQEQLPEATSSSSISSPTSISSFECDNIDDFLGKIDAAIAVTKADIKKTNRNSK